MSGVFIILPEKCLFDVSWVFKKVPSLSPIRYVSNLPKSINTFKNNCRYLFKKLWILFCLLAKVLWQARKDFLPCPLRRKELEVFLVDPSQFLFVENSATFLHF